MRKQLGLSLVELMISITLGLVLMTGVVQMFLSSKVVFNNQQALSRVQETGRLAIDFIARDARMAAYYGCFRITGNTGNVLQNKALQIGGLHEHFDIGIMGYDSAASVPHGAAADLGATPIPDANASVLVIRGASQVGNIINAPSTNNNLLAYTTTAIDASTGCVGELCPGKAAVASDCSKARVFTVNTLAVAGTTLTVSHVDSWSNFTTGQVMPMNTVVYFVATKKDGNGPSLWQRTNNGDALELLEGVENMQVTYATANDSTGILDKGYRLASQITASNEWAKVTSIRVDLLVRSIEKNVLNEPQSYNFGGVDVNPGSTDRRLRQVFSSVVTVRSRMSVN